MGYYLKLNLLWAMGITALVTCGAGQAGDAPRLTRDDGLALVRAYLFQESIEREGIEYTGPLYADPRKNHLSALGLEAHPFASQVRAAVLNDEESSYPEYRVRGFMALGMSAAVERTSRHESQNLLWSFFLDDPRYVARILAALAELDGAEFAAPEELPREVTVDELEDVAERLAASLAEVTEHVGCDGQAITSVFALWDADPMLVSSVLAQFALIPPEQRTVEAATRSVLADGWKITK